MRNIVDNLYTKKVLIEKMIKISYLIKKEQHLYKSIDLNKEYISLLQYGDLPGYYIDEEFILNNSHGS
jgi:hypothetical protein